MATQLIGRPLAWKTGSLGSGPQQRASQLCYNPSLPVLSALQKWKQGYSSWLVEQKQGYSSYKLSSRLAWPK